MLDDADKYVLRQRIASRLDHPSVYMGGPSPTSLRKAGHILDALDRAGRLVPTTCTHDEWDESHHGIACPACGMHMTKSAVPEFLFKPKTT